MDIQVGDRITFMIIDKNRIITEIVTNDNVGLSGICWVKEQLENGFIKILKIERPKYEVVEEKKELLTEEEREFLRKALKFGNYGSDTENGTVKFIIKNGYFIELYYEDWAFNTIYIDKKLYFKNLEQDKQYTLKELGLEEK